MISTIIWFIIALGILVFVHELGHFLVAKKAGIRVERFSIGYPPKMFGFTYGETEYCISWIPFGGYVKVAGMADVGSEDTTGADWEFPSKSVWTRMAVIAAGPFMNFLFAFFAFILLFTVSGMDTLESTAVAPQTDSAAEQAGLERGDIIHKVGERPVSDAYRMIRALKDTEGEGAVLEIERDDRLLNLELPPSEDGLYGLDILSPTLVGQIVPDMPAEAAGLLVGDQITSVADVEVRSWDEMSAQIRLYPDQAIQIEWLRDTQSMRAEITPQSRTEGDETIGLIGIGAHTSTTDVGLIEAVELGGLAVYTSSGMILDFLGELFQGNRSTDELGGPIRIAQMAGQTAEKGFDSFVHFLAMLSVNLAILNLLPIPVLDGGHLVFLSLEAIMRKPLSLRQRALFQQVGLVIMLSIMVLVIFNDINQILFK